MGTLAASTSSLPRLPPFLFTRPFCVHSYFCHVDAVWLDSAALDQTPLPLPPPSYSDFCHVEAVWLDSAALDQTPLPLNHPVAFNVLG